MHQITCTCSTCTCTLSARARKPESCLPHESLSSRGRRFRWLRHKPLRHVMRVLGLLFRRILDEEGALALPVAPAPEAALSRTLGALLAVPGILCAVALVRDALSARQRGGVRAPRRRVPSRARAGRRAGAPAVVALCTHGQQLCAHLARLRAHLRPSPIAARASAHVRRAARVRLARLAERQPAPTPCLPQGIVDRVEEP